MTEAKKAVNYTEAQTAELVQLYQAGETVEALAERFQKSVRSIVAKLSRQGCYQKKQHVRKDGTEVKKKNEWADAIGTILGLAEHDVDSLTKANRAALAAIFAALANSRPL